MALGDTAWTHSVGGISNMGIFSTYLPGLLGMTQDLPKTYVFLEQQLDSGGAS